MKIKTLLSLSATTLALIAIFNVQPALAKHHKHHNRDRDRDRYSAENIDEARDLAAFDEVQFNGIADVDISFGPTQSVTINAPKDLMPYILTEVEHGTLYLEFDDDDSDFFDWFDDDHNDIDVTISIVMTKLTEVDARGVGKVTISGFNGDDLDVELNGVGDVNLPKFNGKRLTLELSGVGDLYANGAVDQLDVRLSGVGEGKLEDLIAKSAWAEASGMGDLHVNAIDLLDATARGFGDVIYHGNPKDIRRHTRGFGDVYSYR